MKKITKAVILEIIPVFLTANFFFIFLMLTEQMVQLADLIFMHSVPIKVIIRLFICYMPSFLIITIPISAILASLLAFSRFSSDSELVAMYACGAGKNTLLKPVIIIGIIITCMSILNSTVLVPKGSRMAVASINEVLQNLSINDIRQKELYTDIDSVIFYAGKKIDNANFNDVIFMYLNPNAIITAKSATIVPNKNKSLMMDFYNGKFTMEGKDNKFTVIDFDNLSVNYPLNITVENMPETERLLSPEELRKNFANPAYVYEYHKRISQPLAALIMITCGFYLGLYFQKAGRSMGLLTGCGVVIVYNFMFIAGSSFIEKVSPVVLAWFPNALMLLVLFLIIRLSNK